MSKSKLETRLERLASAPAVKAPLTISPSPLRQIQQRAPRVPAFKFGIVSFCGKRANCMVLDLSSKGARISLDSAENLPESVRLAIPQHSLRIDATVRWQRGSEVGLQFVGQ